MFNVEMRGRGQDEVRSKAAAWHLSLINIEAEALKLHPASADMLATREKYFDLILIRVSSRG